ncbi:PREDICTED: kelch-like protein 26 [Branchiostoma belcheri]|uniref:Kelch-like protein 26 n=1 Tax=Branchiostoma belcheri TaxID=7741 RepID=A0A6P5AF69_BRABE|nr:PREDICTED: kelch-like protein 26 [Branchiostoma belcheri]
MADNYYSRSYVSDEHSDSLLRGLNALRSDSLLCDVTLVADDQGFQAHRAVLASCSDYFKAMFTSGMRESSETHVELKGVSANGLQHVLDFAYTSRLGLSLQIVQDVIGAASHLQVLPIIVIVEKFLMAEINVDNCLAIGQIAANYDLSSVTNQVNNFILLHFKQVSQIDDFLSLPHERIADLLGSDWLHGCSEVEIFHIALRWLRHDPARMAHASQVMEHIRFPLMSPGDLVDQVQSVDIMDSDSACRRFLLEAFNYQTLPYRQHELQSPRTSVRSILKAIVCIGGTPYTDDRVVKDKLYCQLMRRWFEIGPMEEGRCHHGVAIMDNFIYVVGGQAIQYPSGDGAVATCSRYDVWTGTWVRMKSMHEKRAHFHLSALGGRLYAVGGRNKEQNLKSVEAFLPRENRWMYVAPLRGYSTGHAGCVCDGKLYTSGGYGTSMNNVPHERVLQFYDPEQNAWQCRAPMTTGRIWHCMATLADKLYVMGGDIGDARLHVLTAESYCPASDQWTSIAPMLTGQSEAGTAVIDDKIFLLGGYDWNNRDVIGSVQSYRPEENIWRREASLPQAAAGVACCVVKLPSRYGAMVED